MKPQTLAVLALAGSLLAAQAQTNKPAAAAPPPPPKLSPVEQTINDIKNPAPWFSWGADMRVRGESFDELLTLNPKNSLHAQDYIRFRGRVWASITPIDDLSLNARLVDEVREWMRPAGYTPFSFPPPHSGLDWREGIVDNLNVQWRNINQLPLTVTVGRQDYLPGTPSGLGDGWLVGDGTPLDGSWTYYLDSARLTYNLKEQHTTIEAIGIVQDAKDDAWLPTINNQDYYVTEQNEKGAILWVANKTIPQANLDGYFIYKHDDARDANDLFPVPNNGISKFRPDNADIFTLGGRVSGLVQEHWKYSAEGAYQFGRKSDANLNQNGNNALLSPAAQSTGFRDIDAFGVNAKAAYLFKDKMNSQVNLSFEYLTGDDRNTKNDEMFDNLWGRYPRWSEIGLYSFAPETRIGNEANIWRIGPGWSCSPTKKLDLSASYYALLSQEDVATRATGGASPLFAGNANLANNAVNPDHGTFRGHFLQAILKYKFSKHLMGHLWGEVEFPGDYYANRTTWYFLRPEITLTF